MNEYTIKERLQAFGIGQVLNWADNNPDKNLPKLMDWFDRMDADNDLIGARTVIHSILDNPQSTWYKFIKSFWTDVDDGVRRKFFENFVANIALVGYNRQLRAKEEHGCNVPWSEWNYRNYEKSTVKCRKSRSKK